MLYMLPFPHGFGTMSETAKLVFGWARDPKWWAVVFLAWALSILFYDVRPSLQSMGAEHEAIEASNARVIELMRQSLEWQRIEAHSSVQDCVNRSGNRADLVSKCFAVLNGATPSR